MKISNNKYKILLFLIIVTTVFSACEGLDEDPSARIAAESFYVEAESLKQGVIGVHSDFSKIWYRTGCHIPTIGDDILTVRIGSSNQASRSFDTFQKDDNINWMYFEVWNPCYVAVRTINTFIVSVENNRKNIEVEENLINQRLAEARYMRANTFFALTRIWGDVPYFEDTSVKSKDTRKLDKRVIYSRIINDLEYAEKYCVNAVEAPGQVSKWAAKAALAKVYMQLTGYPFNEADKWEKVKQYTGEIIQSGKFELMPNYGDLFKYTKFSENQENIFTLTFGIKESGAWQRNYGKPWNAWVQIQCQWLFYQTFPEGERKDFSIQANMEMIPYKYFIHPCISKFLFGTVKFDPAGKDDQEYIDAFEHEVLTSNNIALDRLADMYLLWAEADARITGNISAQALEYLNMIKRRAKGDINKMGGSFYNMPMEGVDVAIDDYASTEEFIDAIFDERGWEFMAEWGYRWFDLVRLQKLAEVTAKRNDFDLDVAIKVYFDDWKARNPDATQPEIDAQAAAMKIQASEMRLDDNNPTAEKYAFAPLPQEAIDETPGLLEPSLTEFEP